MPGRSEVDGGSIYTPLRTVIEHSCTLHRSGLDTIYVVICLHPQRLDLTRKTCRPSGSKISCIPRWKRRLISCFRGRKVCLRRSLSSAVSSPVSRFSLQDIIRGAFDAQSLGIGAPLLDSRARTHRTYSCLVSVFSAVHKGIPAFPKPLSSNMHPEGEGLLQSPS